LNKNEESAWQKASASLDASAKIYGYRVDCVHSDTFKFLGGLNRTDNKDDENDNLENIDGSIKKEKIEIKVKMAL
jgi:condensin complex subunit 2